MQIKQFFFLAFFLTFLTQAGWAQTVSVKPVVNINTNANPMFNDPTRPLNFTEAAATSAQGLVSAILYDKQKKWVIINEQLYKEGDKFDQCLVMTIKPDAVLMRCPEGINTLPLLQYSIKR